MDEDSGSTSRLVVQIATPANQKQRSPQCDAIAVSVKLAQITMAGWLSSRLKAAEQLLQQLDQQAAVSLQKQEKNDSDTPTFELPRGSRHADHDQQYLNSKKSDLPPQAGTGIPRHAKPVHPSLGSRRNGQDGLGPSKEDTFGKQDWTELLGSVDLSPPASATRSSSSVGSTDYAGTQNSYKGGPQRFPQQTGKGGVTPQHFNGLTPASRNSSEVAGLPYPPSVQASRTKVATSHIVDPRPSELLGKADGYQDDEKLPRRLEFDAQAVEGTGEYAPTEQQSLDAVSYTNDLGRSEDPFLQQVNQDGDFTELELNVPGEKKSIEDHNVKFSGSDSNVEHVGHPMPPLSNSLHEREESGMTETLALGDSVTLVNEREMHREDQAGENTVAEGLNTGSMTENVPDNPGMPVEADIPNIAAQLVQEDANRQNEEGRSVGYSDLSDLSESDVSQSGSDSESDSEYEERVRRKRERRKDIAERRVAKAAAAEAARAAIRKREEFVAKLEEEKADLEQQLVEWEERQAKEAEELNLTMKEVAEAVEIEKQRHAVTRRQGLAQEAQLEADNQELAKALAAAERNLEDENARVALARSKVEARDILRSDLERKISTLQFSLRPPSLPQDQDSKIERETAEEQYAGLAARLERYQIKAKELEEKISIASDAHYTPSVMELELETRLNHLTDHLIQKQAQVEALSTEKATLHFRLEAISNTLREEKSAAQLRATKRSKGVHAGTDWSAYDDDLEYGLSKPYSSKDKNLFMGTDPDVVLNQTSGTRPLMGLVRQMDTLFLGGARILRTSGSARAVAALYLFLLHWWVLFILFMHMRSSGSGSMPRGNAQAGLDTLSSLTESFNATSLGQR